MKWTCEIVDGPHSGVTEGPVWSGDALLYTHIPSSRILLYDPRTRTSRVYREGTNCANGLALDSDGGLIACEGGAGPADRRVVRYEEGAPASVLAARFEGGRLNMPNDLAFDEEGRIWFTDPFYEGAAGDWESRSDAHGVGS